MVRLSHMHRRKSARLRHTASLAVVSALIAWVFGARPMVAHADSRVIQSAAHSSDYPFEPVPNMKSRLGVMASKAARLILPAGGEKTVDYMVARVQLAHEVATELRLDPSRLNIAWSRAPRDHQIALMFALSQLDVKYEENQTSPGVALDCSGLLYLAWRTANIEMPRGSQSQYNIKIRIARKQARAGDILGTGTHVQMWLGVGNAIVEAPSTGLKVRIRVVTDERAAKWTWANPSLIPITKWHPTSGSSSTKN